MVWHSFFIWNKSRKTTIVNMFVIEKLSSNSIICTLTEKVSIESPVYLFEFENELTHIKYYCIAADISIYPERYNNFIIVDKVSPNPLLGEIQLIDLGFYNYTVYQQHSTTNLDPTDTLGILEIGKMKFITPATSIEIYNAQPSSIKVYQSS